MKVSEAWPVYPLTAHPQCSFLLCLGQLTAPTTCTTVHAYHELTHNLGSLLYEVNHAIHVIHVIQVIYVIHVNHVNDGVSFDGFDDQVRQVISCCDASEEGA